MAIFLLLASLAFFTGCRSHRPALIPEISPPLVQEEVCTWKGHLAGNAIFPCAGGIGWLDAAGRILVWDADKKSVSAIFTAPFAVTVPPFLQGDILVLRGKVSDRLLVFDLAAGTVKFESRKSGAGQILGVGQDRLVCLEDGRLAVRPFARPAEVFRAPQADEKFFNCHFSPERILVLGRERLYTFWNKRGEFESQPLPHPAVSPFYFDGEHIYYGSSERFLVKFALGKNRLVWKLKLGQVLERRPLAFAGAIIASPADQNVLQVNRRGSILWWQALRSTMNFDLLPMSENLAAMLLNREIKFIDPRRRQVTVFQGMAQPLSPPLAFRRDLYFMTYDGETYRLLRVGNRYGIEVELEPAPVRWAGKSLRFSVQTHNLPEPKWECVILDAKERPVFSRSMDGADKASLVWVPQQAGNYVIRVQAKAREREAVKDVPVRVLDPLQIVPGFYLHF